MKKLYFSILFALIVFNAIGQKVSKTIAHGGITRAYVEYVPSIHSNTTPVPLVICLHGLGDNMTNFSGIGMRYVADTANFIVLTPQAIVASYFGYVIGTAWNSGASYMGIVLNPTIDDVGFLQALIDTTSKLYNIDNKRIYVCGFSMGGFMTNRMACEKGNKIAAVASVAGTIGASLTCNPIRPIPVCHFHGTADSTVYYTNNTYGIDPDSLVNFWRHNNQCEETPIYKDFPDIMSDSMTVQNFLYNSPSTGANVEFYKVIGADHQWLFYPDNDISYTIEIWKFFSKYVLPDAWNITEKQSNQDIIVYTNNSNIVIQNLVSNTLVVKVYDINGRYINSTSSNDSEILLPVNNYAKGILLVEVYDKVKNISNCYKVSIK